MKADELRIVGSSQTNVVMEAELTRICLRALNRRPPKLRKEGLGQLVMPFDPELAWAAVSYLRTPTRVVWDVARSKATRLEPLYDGLYDDLVADPRALWRDGDSISVEARRMDSFAAGERQVVGTVKNAIIEAARRRGARLHVDPDAATVRWVARLDERDELVLSIDLGGGSLAHRGWRREAGDAPLREHLAAVLLMLARFDPRHDVLVDPMCGAGTIPIEAVHAARGTPRPTPFLEPLGLARAKAAPLWPDATPFVIGCDLDLEVLRAAKDNARTAGVTGDVTLQRADAASLSPELVADIARERGRPLPRTGLILTNPPYGERLDEYDLTAVYHALAMSCRRFLHTGWRAGFLVGSPLLEDVFFKLIGPPRIKKPIANANLRAYFYLYDL